MAEDSRRKHCCSEPFFAGADQGGTGAVRVPAAVRTGRRSVGRPSGGLRQHGVLAVPAPPDRRASRRRASERPARDAGLATAGPRLLGVPDGGGVPRSPARPEPVSVWMRSRLPGRTCVGVSALAVRPGRLLRPAARGANRSRGAPCRRRHWSAPLARTSHVAVGSDVPRAAGSDVVVVGGAEPVAATLASTLWSGQEASETPRSTGRLPSMR